MLRKNKRNYFSKLHTKDVSDNRKFWKASSPLLFRKNFNKESIMLKESNKTFTNNPKPLVINSVVTFCKTLT